MSSLKTWAQFLEARILQEKGVRGEKGADEKALPILEKLCADNPENTSFLKAKAWSLSVLNREQDAASSLIEAEYLSLSRQLSGENDIAQNWIRGLEGLRTKISELEKTKICTSTMAW